MDKHSAAVEQMLAMVRMGLWGEGCVPGAGLPSGNGWESIIAEAGRQGVQGLFCEGVRMLPASQMPPAQLRMTLLLNCDALERRSRHVDSTAEDLLERFRSAGLAPVVQKGPAVARHYPEPFLRKSGDIDLYFPPGQFERAKALAGTWAEVLDEPDGSVCYTFADVTVEHHNRFFDSKAQFDGIGPDSPEAAVLLQITHILKHSLGPGIGLKQICDYAVVTRRILAECDIPALASCIRGAHLQRWLGRLDSFINTFLGVPDGELLTTKAGFPRHSPAPLLEIVLQGGEFGHYNPFRKIMASPRLRKLNTARFFFQRLPFALFTAPGEWWHTFSMLIKGNLTH